MEIAESELRVSGIRSPLLSAAPAGEERAEEAVVFVHGNPGSSEDWRRLVEAAGRFARAVAFDMPGFGRADKPRSFDATLEGFAAHLGAALEALGIRRVHLVLHDFGGPWGLEWACRHPSSLASVVLVDTGVFVGFRWHRLARLWRTPVVGELVMLATTRRRFVAEIRRSEAGLPAPILERMARDMDAATKRTVLRLYRSTDLDTVSRRHLVTLRPLERPALVVWGGRDRFLSYRVAERQKDVFPGAEVVLLPESGHWPMLDDPEGVEAPVVAFLGRMLRQAKTSA